MYTKKRAESEIHRMEIMAQGSNIFPFRKGFACARVRFFL